MAGENKIYAYGFTHNLLPFSFRGIWITNRERIPERELRNADQLYVPQHNYATLKRMPLYSIFPLYGIISLFLSLTRLIQDKIILSKKWKKLFLMMKIEWSALTASNCNLLESWPKEALSLPLQHPHGKPV
jgi:hypothetical protein